MRRFFILRYGSKRGIITTMAKYLINSGKLSDKELFMESNVVLQDRHKSVIFWIGLAGAVLQGISGVLMAAGVVDQTVGGAIVAAISAVEGYAVSCNPSIKLAQKQ